MQNKPFTKVLSLYLVVATFFLAIPAQGWAMLIPVSQASPARQADLGAIQKTLESSVVKQRLMDYGLSPGETMARVNALSDEQISQFAAHTDALQAGGDGHISLVALLLIIILVILIVQAPGQADRANA